MSEPAAPATLQRIIEQCPVTGVRILKRHLRVSPRRSSPFLFLPLQVIRRADDGEKDGGGDTNDDDGDDWRRVVVVLAHDACDVRDGRCFSKLSDREAWRRV